MKLTRVFLLGIVVSLTLAAALGVYAFLFGQFGSFESRIIFTTLSIGLFSVTSLGAAVVFERARWRPLMFSALVVSGFGLLLYLYAIWLHQFLAGNWHYDELLAKTMFLAAVWALGLPHMGLLGLAPHAGPWLRWARPLAIACVCLLAGVITLATLVSMEPDEGLWFRAIGVFGILAALGTLSVPILTRVQRIDQTVNTESTPLLLTLTCPRCLTTQTVETGHTRCGGCRLKFHIEIEEPRCPQCNYLLHMLTEPACPECGHRLGPEELATQSAATMSPDSASTPSAPQAGPHEPSPSHEATDR